LLIELAFGVGLCKFQSGSMKVLPIQVDFRPRYVFHYGAGAKIALKLDARKSGGFGELLLFSFAYLP
jgi:hypothetical protein